VLFVEAGCRFEGALIC